MFFLRVYIGVWQLIKWVMLRRLVLEDGKMVRPQLRANLCVVVRICALLVDVPHHMGTTKTFHCLPVGETYVFCWVPDCDVPAVPEVVLETCSFIGGHGS
jgi:hypothetical protein